MLTKDGEAQARNTGQHFVLNSFVPDFILTSTAVRARATSKLVLEAAQVPPENLHASHSLYETDASEWLSQIQLVAPDFTTLLCVGHNPAISGLASALLHQAIDLAPAGFVVIKTTAATWNKLDGSVSELVTMVGAS